MTRLRALAALLSLVLGLSWLQPYGATAIQIAAALGDPLRIAAFRLALVATPERLEAEVRAALAADDPDLAESFVALAAGEGIALDPDLLAAVEEAAAPDPLAAAGAFLRGATIGDANGIAGLTGAFAGDLVGIGDLRDLSREGLVYLGGGDPDAIVVGLSAVGLAVTGATWGSAGLTAPARAGLTLVKSAKRVGRLSKPFAESLGRLVAAAVDGPALRRGLAAAGSLDGATAKAAFRGAVRPDALAPLVRVAGDASTVTTKAGVRALDDTLAVAVDPTDLRHFARLADGFGDRTRAVVKLLGRGAIIAVDLMLALLGWLYGAAAWALGLAMGAAALGRGLARTTRRRPKAPPARVEPALV